MKYFIVAYQYTNSEGFGLANDTIVTSVYVNYNTFVLNLKKRDSSIKGIAIINIIELSEVEYSEFKKK